MLKYTGCLKGTQELTPREYQQFNNQFSRKLIWHFGTGNGFYSELNGLLLGVLYAAQYGYRFVLYAQDNKAGMYQGWEDVFQSFCPRYHFPLIGRSILIGTSHNCHRNKLTNFYKLFSSDITEDDVFWYTHTNRFALAQYDIPTLGIKGDIHQAMRRLIPLVYRFNDYYHNLIDTLHTTLPLPQQYVGFHIRSGDKAQETALIPPQRYIDAATQATSIRNAFIYTDDVNIVTQLQKDNPQWNILSYADNNDTGYNIQKWATVAQDKHRRQLVKMFASVEILLQSELFVGTFSSNPGMFIGMLLDRQHIIGMDYPEWLLL